MAIFKSIKSAFRTVFCCSPASQVVDEEKHPYPPSYGAGSVPAHQIDYAAYQQYQLHKVQQQRLQEYAYPPPPPKPKPRHKSRPPKYTAPRVELIETKPLPAIPARVHPQYTYQYTPPRPPPVQPHVQVPVRVKVEQRSPTPPPLVHRIDYAGSPLVKPVSVQSSPRPAPLQAPPAVIQAPVVTRIERRPSIKQAERPPIKPVEARSVSWPTVVCFRNLRDYCHRKMPQVLSQASTTSRSGTRPKPRGTQWPNRLLTVRRRSSPKTVLLRSS